MRHHRIRQQSYPPAVEDRRAGPSAPISAAVEIRRPADEVYAFVSDPANMPRYLGDVTAVEILSPTRSRWTIGLPFGLRSHWISEITEKRPREAFSYRVKIAGHEATWLITFTGHGSVTTVREELTMPRSRLSRAALKITRKNPPAEVASNLNRLKQLLETGTVTDSSNALPGRF